jgi:pimeloyl-ACP methyl ester carboxylesterase
MASVQWRQARLNYTTVGNGPPAVLHHGLFGGGAAWLERGGWRDALQGYQLILLDGIGHGDSDCPSDPTYYEPSARAAQVVAVLDDAGIDGAHYLGYSMGASVGCYMARHQSHRLRSLALGGWDPEIGMTLAVEALSGVAPDGVESFDVATQFARADSEIAAAMEGHDETGWRRCWEQLDAFEDHRDALAAADVPLLLFCGEQDWYFDGMRGAATELGVPFVPIPERDHIGAFDEARLVAPALTELWSS